MVFFQPVLLFSATSQTATGAATTFGLPAASVAKDFFMKIFLNPGASMFTTIAFCAIIIAPCIGIAFLIKLIYQKYKPTDG